MANIPLESITFPGLSDKYTIPQIDTTLAVSGKAADAKATGDAIADVVEDVTALQAELPDLTETVMSAFVVDTATGAIATFPDGADLVPVKSLTVEIEPVQSGSGDPSPSNIRPITGHTQAVVTRTGKNLFNKDGEVIYGFWLNGAWTAITNYDPYSSWCGVVIPVVEGQTYTWSGVPTVGGTQNVWLANLDNTGYLSTISNSGTATKTATAPTGAKAMWLALKGNDRSQWGDIQFELGSTASSHSPYQGETYTIDLDGTRYGGTLDVTSGVMTVDRAFAVYDGTNLSVRAVSQSSASGNWYGQATLPSTAKLGVWLATAISNSLKAGITPTAQGCFSIIGSGNEAVFVLTDQTITTVSAFNAYLADNPIQLCYVLAEPVSVQLTAEEVTTLLGQNNIFCDAGNVAVSYRADTKLYIEHLTAPTEDDMIANTNIPDATYFMVGNTLYLSTTTIPAGDTINPGTNCTLMNLASALNALNS